MNPFNTELLPERLDAVRLVAMIESRAQRVRESFPGSGLSILADKIAALAESSAVAAARIVQPHWLLRLTTVGVLLAIVIAGAVIADITINTVMRTGRIDDLSRYGIALPIGLASSLGSLPVLCFWVLGLEDRWKQAIALRELHRLRCVVHVIDMHQINKASSSAMIGDPALGEIRQMRTDELARYLETCADLVSLAGKIAVLYVLSPRHNLVLAAVSDIEQATTGLSIKIWQKIGTLPATRADQLR